MTNPVIPAALVCFSLRLLSVILSVLAKTMILLVVAFVLQWIMRNASPKLRHGLWLSAIFCCLLVLGLSLRGPLYQVGPRPSNGAVSPLSALTSALVPAAGSFAVGRDLPPIASVVWRPTLMPTLWPSLWPSWSCSSSSPGPSAGG